MRRLLVSRFVLALLPLALPSAAAALAPLPHRSRRFSRLAHAA